MLQRESISGIRGLSGARSLRRSFRVRHRSPATTVVIPVPEVEAVYDRWNGDRQRLGVPGLPPHVTILYPFLPASAIDPHAERGIEAIAESRNPFGYTIARVGRFDNVLYLAPSPATPFIDLTEALFRRWPDHPPYGGQFPEVIPHITLSLGEEPSGLAQAVEPALPIGVVARELVLLEQGEGGRWLERRRFALGDPRQQPSTDS